MNRIDNKGFTIIEVILSFSFVMIISVGLFMSATNYKNKQQEESVRRDLETFKMNIISAIHKEIDKKGLKEIKRESGVINLYFYDNSSMKLRMISEMDENNNYRNAGINFGETNYYLADKKSTSIESITLVKGSVDIDSSKANIYKLTVKINSDNKDIGEFEFNIILSSFSNT